MKTIHPLNTPALFLSIILVLILFTPVSAVSQQSDLQQIADRAVAAGIEQNRIELIRERAASRGVDDSIVARMIEPAAELAEKGMPTDFIIQKMMEGFAKGVPGGRMIPVLDVIQRETPQAVALSNRWMEKPEVAPYMQGLGGGQAQFRRELVNANLKSLTQQVPSETIEMVLNELGQPAVLENSSPRAIAAAVGILPDLPASMLNEAGVQAVIANAVRGGFSANEIQRLPGAVNAAERRSQLPAASVLDGLSNQIGNGIPASQILQNLFNGNVNAGPPSNIPGRPGNPPGGRPGQGPGNQGN